MAPVKAETAAQLQAQKAALQKSIQDQQAQKAKQQAVSAELQKQIGSLNTNIQNTRNTISSINGQITQTGKDITDLNGKISDKSTQIQAEEDKLNEAIRNMYIDAATTNNPILALAQPTVSDAVAGQQDYQAIDSAINDKAQQITKDKADLESQRNDVVKKQNSLTTLRDQAKQQADALSQQLALQNTLLQNTYSSIAQIDQTISDNQAQIRAVDGKISALEAALAASKNLTAASGDLVAVNTSPYYSQRDPAWGGQHLDPSSSDSDTFAESGCLITSLTNVINWYGVSKTPPQVLSDIISVGGMYGDLFAWSGIRKASNGKVDLAHGGKEAINWGVVDSMLAQNHPVIVGINPSGNLDIHWVSIIGKSGDKYAIDDPYYAAGRFYPASWIRHMVIILPV